MSKEMRKYIDTFKERMLNESKEKYILVDTSDAIDVPSIRPLIKGVKLKLKRVIDGDIKTYVVDYKGDEVYLNRKDFEYVE